MLAIDSRHSRVASGSYRSRHSRLVSLWRTALDIASWSVAPRVRLLLPTSGGAFPAPWGV
jgi:hypothetical protein